MIRFVSPAGMNAISKDTYSKEYKVAGVSYAKIAPGMIYIDSDLTGDIRSHVILWSFLYEIGFKGETLRYPDSVFYYLPNTNAKLSVVDQKAIQIMYGAGLYPGMTVANVKTVVNVKTN